MRQDDRSLDFVAVLAPWTRPAGMHDIALFEQFGDREFGGVHGSLSLNTVSTAPPLVASVNPLRSRDGLSGNTFWAMNRRGRGESDILDQPERLSESETFVVPTHLKRIP